MNVHVADRPLSLLERQSKDSKATTLQEAVRAIVEDPDRRWTDAEFLVIGLATQALKTFLTRGLDNGAKQ